MTLTKPSMRPHSRRAVSMIDAMPSSVVTSPSTPTNGCPANSDVTA